MRTKIVTLFLIGILCLAMAIPSCSHTKHYGPQWAIWTHSEDRDECQIKTAIWFTLGVIALVYILDKAKNPEKEKKIKAGLRESYR